MIPTKLEEWNYDSIKYVVENYLEGDIFDFKCMIESKQPDERKKLIRSVCAFANTSGGFLIFGVCPKNGSHEIRGLKRSTEYARNFGDKISLIEPTVYFTFGPFITIPESDKVLFVIHVPTSPKRPHITDEHTFYYRTNKGNEQMNYHQIKDAFLRFEEREHKLRLLYTELLFNKKIAESLITEEILKRNDNPNAEFEVDVIKSLLPDIYPLIQEKESSIDAILDLRMVMAQVNQKTRTIQSLLPTSHKSTKINQLVAAIHIDVTRKILPKIKEVTIFLETDHGFMNDKGIID